MLNQSELSSLKKGDAVDHYLLLKRCEIRLTKNGKEFLSVDLGDKSTTLSANIWENFREIYERAKPGDVIKVSGSIDDYQGALQIKISSLRPLNTKEKISPRDFLPHSKRNLAEMQREFRDRIDKISNEHLHTLLKNIFNDQNFQKFSSAPAGKSWHHSYLGGLLEHTLEIIKICDLMCDIHPDINRDLLISGAMLHDFGKTIELSYDEVFEYTDKGKLIGHIVIAAMLINEEADKIPGFPEDLKNCLIHLILSHQGKLEFASPVVPKTAEAIALYQADELSAKVNAYKNAISSESRSDSNWTKYITLASTDLYTGHINQQDQENNKESNKTLFD
jgi:3'-5' exoribonuclease